MSADSEWSFLLPRDGMGGLIAMLAAYFDDAGTHDSSAVIGFAGLIGIEEQWKAFEGAWKAKLRAPLPGKGPKGDEFLSQFIRGLSCRHL